MPDLLIANARIFDTSGVSAGSILVQDGRISATGSDLDVPPGTPELDAAGGLVLAGFQDSHIHPYHAGLELLQCSLSELHSAAAYLGAIGEYAAAHPELEWIEGAGWGMDAFPGGIPTAAELDRVVPDRPAFFPNRDGHGAWVNTRALQIAGIDDATPDPFDGRIERDADGHAIGMLQEGAQGLVTPFLPGATQDTMDEAFRVAQRQLLAWGVTAWQDAIVGSGIGGKTPDLLDSYLRMADSGELRAHVVGALWWDRDRGLEQIDELVERRARAEGRDRFRATSVKIMQDGVAENHTAAMLADYLDPHQHGVGGAGTSFVAPELLTEAVIRLDALGFQVHFHALGDRAVRESLDAIEAAQAANGIRDARHHLAHLQVIHPDDVPRFARLGAVANAQPLWARHEVQMDELTIPFLGDERSRWQYPFGSIVRSGGRIAFGSDWPVSTADPIQIIHTAVNRTPTEGGARPFLAEQALSLADSLVAHTAGTAHVNHDEGHSGRIAPGLRGDLVVLSDDPFDRPAAEFLTSRVRATVLDGEVVYEA